MNWNKIFNYKEGKLYWNEWKTGRRKSLEAGCKSKAGYVIIAMPDKTLHYAHRIIWEMQNGKALEEKQQIDHIDHNRSNNKIENLRISCDKSNRKNMSKNKSNKTGVCGVYWAKHISKWIAQISMENKTVYLGAFSDFAVACEAMIVAEVSMGYHPNHGK